MIHVKTRSKILTKQGVKSGSKILIASSGSQILIEFQNKE